MSRLVLGFGLFITLLSVYGMVQPRQLTSGVMHVVKQPWGLAFAIAVRVSLGAMFLASVKDVSSPVFVSVVGWLMLASAAAIALMGRQRMIRVAGFWAEKGNAVIRAWLLMGVIFGLAIVLAA